VSLVGERRDSARVDPAIIEIEQRADRDRVVDGVVCPAGRVEGLHILGGDFGRAAIYLGHEAEERLLLFGERGRLEIVDDGVDQRLGGVRVEREFRCEQDRRDRGVRLQSERAVIRR